ncbi:MAG: methionyl-tRNA formyltransferase [Treponema sp.]|nr:methionyl-tRNA formyltransferase [Treponema sp.]
MLKILYAGSPVIAVKPLIEIECSQKHQIVGVLTNPPKPQKRGKELVSTPVAQALASINNERAKCGKHEIALFEPQKLSEIHSAIQELKPDILVCFAYGKIFTQEFMSLFPLGGINLHPSLLPRYRGCAPIPAAILNKDKETGFTIQRIAQRMDSGNILLQTRFCLNGTEYTEDICEKVSNEGGSLFLKVLEKIENNTITETVQNEDEATYFGMLKKEDACINWKDSAENICAKIRAFEPWPGAYTTIDGTPLKIHRATVSTKCFSKESVEPGTVLGTDNEEGILFKTGDGVLAVQNLQWQAKKAMNCKDFINGARNFAGLICN